MNVYIFVPCIYFDFSVHLTSKGLSAQRLLAVGIFNFCKKNNVNNKELDPEVEDEIIDFLKIVS